MICARNFVSPCGFVRQTQSKPSWHCRRRGQWHSILSALSITVFTMVWRGSLNQNHLTSPGQVRGDAVDHEAQKDMVGEWKLTEKKAKANQHKWVAYTGAKIQDPEKSRWMVYCTVSEDTSSGYGTASIKITYVLVKIEVFWPPCRMH